MQTGQNQNKHLVIPDEIRAFLESILEDGDMMILDSNSKERMIQELFIELDAYLRTKVLEYLPENKLKDFVEISKNDPTPEKMTAYLQENLPNSQEVFAQAFEEFRDIYLEGVEKSRSSQINQQSSPSLEDIAAVQ